MSDFRPYLCISASAGSGKTWQLAHRVLRLLAMDVPADEIGAYTFSRKAAGEIFDNIVKYLRLAAESEEGAREAAKHIGAPHSREAFLHDLRTVFARLHRLRIGTLDSRISQMLSAASVEIGLPPDFSVMDNQSAEYLRLQARVLNSLFLPGRLDPQQSDTFLHLFEEATFGQAEKNFLRLLQRFLSDHRAAFLALPDAEAWQGPPVADPPEILDEDDRRARADRLRELLPERVAHKTALNSLTKLVEQAAAFTESSLWSRDAPSGKSFEAFLENRDSSFTFSGKEIDLGPDAAEDLHALIDHVAAVALERDLRRTRALYGFLYAYEARYRERVLPGGRLSFDDACNLMADFERLGPAELAFRLDGEIHHWLLDEFQDTNRLQWNVLRPFLEEVLQDPEQRRSFFYVGDVKQAIYAWRGGDSELFGRILERWPSIKKQKLDRSFRSARPVLDLVNHLLGDLPRSDEVPDDAVDQWNDAFSPHHPAKENLPGFAEVLQCEPDGPVQAEVVLNLLRTLPSEAETAILVRSNTEGADLADLLRGAGFKVSLEGTAELRDDTAVEAVLAALTLAAHPGDAFCRQLTRLAGLDIDPLSLLDTMRTDGVTAAVRELAAELPLDPDADFSRARLRRLVDLALEFDALGDPSPDRFLSYVDLAHIKENEARGVIRIMTVHQSKGLGFDTVIVPIKGGGFFRSETGGLVTSAPDDPSPWATLLPPKPVCRRIPEYREILERVEADGAYETLCTLYVALTRARQSLHVVLNAPPAKSRGSLSQLHNWMAHRAEGAGDPPEREIQGARALAAFGDPEWYRDAGPADTTPAPVPLPFAIPTGARTVSRLEPSQADAQPRKLEQAFAYIPSDGRALGTRVHDLLKELEWTDATDPDAFLARHGEPADSRAADHVRRAFDFRELARPSAVTALWREQKFETVLNEGWVTGIFDRVVLFEDGAWIQDYKTNLRCDDATVAHYAPQMRLYRRVLADMLNYDPARIRCQLLFTHTGDVRDIPA